MLNPSYLPLLQASLERLASGFSELPEAPLPDEPQALAQVLGEVADRLKDNYPYFHPLYAGQMLAPPHPIAHLAYALAMAVNPNNHALDGGRASSHMEKEAVAELANMLGWQSHLGHLTGGGTMANLEALWVSGRLHPGKAILASQQAHYTHQRISGVLGLPFESIACDRQGRIDIQALENRLSQGDVGTVVATLGTTATASVDPLPELLALRDQYGVRLHADAAYGGYFYLCETLSESTRKSFDRLPEVDSFVVDPHKHGLQPYGCGCILFRDPSVGRFYKHDSPYTYFSSNELHLGEISLECSRPGAAAVALWATQRLFPLVRGGAFAKGLQGCRRAALHLYDTLKTDPNVIVPFAPELDIVVWALKAESVSRASELAKEVFVQAEKQHLYLALAELPVEFFDLKAHGVLVDRPRMTCLRSVLMKPEHEKWIEHIETLWERVTVEVYGA